ncbi:MAG TPA: carboxylesterase [Gammaproteobacteria bacterium]|jgi:phospholipase/carboxylesterase|nr:carboxylesterase [Gammaproteobacteria bacterium]
MLQTESNRNAIEIETSLPVKKTVILLHGLGADATDFVPIVNALALPASDGIRFVFPYAPIQPVTINNGYHMPAWYDIYGSELLGRTDEAGIDRSIQIVNGYIQKEVERGMASHNIVLAGFSQGAVISLCAGLTHKEPLGGIIALSGYLPMADKMITRMSEANARIPIFLAHGTVDTVVPYAAGITTRDTLEKHGCSVSWHTYNAAHTVSHEEVEDISKWLAKRFS